MPSGVDIAQIDDDLEDPAVFVVEMPPANGVVAMACRRIRHLALDLDAEVPRGSPMWHSARLSRSSDSPHVNTVGSHANSRDVVFAHGSVVGFERSSSMNRSAESDTAGGICIARTATPDWRSSASSSLCCVDTSGSLPA